MDNSGLSSLLGKWSIEEQWLLFQSESLFHLHCEEKWFETAVTGPYPARLWMREKTEWDSGKERNWKGRQGGEMNALFSLKRKPYINKRKLINSTRPSGRSQLHFTVEREQQRGRKGERENWIMYSCVLYFINKICSLFISYIFNISLSFYLYFLSYSCMYLSKNK